MKKTSQSALLCASARIAWAQGVAVACTLNVPSTSEIYGEAGAAGRAAADSNVAPGAVSNAPNGGLARTPNASAPDARAAAADVGGVTAARDASVTTPATLLLHYSFEDVIGPSITDDSGNGRFAIAAGTPAPLTEPGRIGRALHLLGGSSNQHVELPANILRSLPAVSITAWLNLTTNTAWDRLFDFNAGDATWFFFSPTGWNAQTLTFGTHLGVRLNADVEGASYFSLTEPLEPGSWHHVAVVWAPPLLSYYRNGALTHTVPVALRPEQLAATDQNWIGRSSYPGDPYFSGLVDEFRVYSGALTDAEISQLSSEGE